MRLLLDSKLLFLWLLAPFFAEAQGKYWISNADAENLTLPIPTACSQWLESCTYELSESEIHQFRSNGIEILPSLTFSKTGFDKDTILSYPLEQVDAELFRALGLQGAGVKIGIIDGGFLGADEDPALQHIFKNGRVNYYKDYVTPDMKPYEGSPALDDNHGTEVWRLIGGYHAKKNILHGLATESTYYLARTDHGGYEKRVEEEYLIQALEAMDSMGVKLVNISLGYNIEFTNPKENYTPKDMNGKTTMIARAAEIAALEKGMLLVVAAGNEGSQQWRILSSPGDAEHVLTVGSVTFKTWDKINYSSVGPEFTSFVKPDVSIYSSSGTSYATPVITGMAACLWQLDPALTNLEIIELFRSAGNFYPYPNNYVGYGVPSSAKLLRLVDGNTLISPRVIKTRQKKLKIALESDLPVVAYHKRSNTHVAHRTYYRKTGKGLKIRRPEGIMQTSLLVNKEIIEIFWE